MENSVLGNALEGVPEGEDEEKPPKDSNVESTESVDGEDIVGFLCYYMLSNTGSINIKS